MKKTSFARVGVVSEARFAASTATTAKLRPAPVPVPVAKDYFVEVDGLRFAGRHLLVEFWQAEKLNDLDAIESAMRAGVIASGATLLHLHLHHFSPNGGISGVAVLAESHISIHTWPERGYAAIDIFMCGACNPYDAIPALRAGLTPGSVTISENKRGVVA